MDETSYDIPYYLDPNSGAYTGGTDMSGFYTDPWAYTSSTDPYGLGGLDFSSLGGTNYSDPYGLGAYDFGSLFSQPDISYTPTYADYTSPTTDTTSSDFTGGGLRSTVAPSSSIMELGQGINAPAIVQPGGVAIIPDVAGNIKTTVGANNLYDTGTVGLNGAAQEVPALSGKAAVDYWASTDPLMNILAGGMTNAQQNQGTSLQDYLNNAGYGGLRSNLGTGDAAIAAAQANALKAAGGGASGSSGGSGNQQAKTPLQQGLSNAALIAQLLQLLQGKNAKAPAGIGTNQGATGMQWATGGLTSPLNAVRRG